MRLKVNMLDFEAGGKGVVILNSQDAEVLGLHALDRVELRKGRQKLIAIVDIAERFAPKGQIITNLEVNRALKLRQAEPIEVVPTSPPKSVNYIREKLSGIGLNYKKMYSIVSDIVSRRLSDIELSAFVTALDVRGMSMDETEALSKAMFATGSQLRLPAKPIVDKHSCGGVPGDKTSLLVVPIIASAGLTIPKTSSRAITSPAGTADRMEILAPVSHSAEEIVKIVKKTNGCLVWGGALDLAPADDAFIKIEYPLGIDPLLLPSIMSKKKAVGAQYVVIDLPTGRGTKIKTIGTAHELAAQFIELGKRLGIVVACAVTFGEQPIGTTMGPALEAQEALLALQGKGPKDLIEKAVSVSGLLFELLGSRDGKGHALRLIKSGKAERKMRQIIAAQGGDPKIRPSDIPVGQKTADICAGHSGKVLWIKNAEISAIARAAGAPHDKGAGIKLHCKIGTKIARGQKLFTIHAESSHKLNLAYELAQEYKPVIVGKSLEEKMLMSQIPTKLPHRRLFMLER